MSGPVGSDAKNWSVPGVWGDNTYAHEAGHLILGRSYGDGPGHDSLAGSIMTGQESLNGRHVLPEHIQAAVNNGANNVSGWSRGK